MSQRFTNPSDADESVPVGGRPAPSLCPRCQEVNPPHFDNCRGCGQRLPEVSTPSPDDPAGMVIDQGRGKRMVGFLLWMVAVAATAGLLFVLLRRFTDSVQIAVAVVVFMLAYMLIMSHVVMKKQDEGKP